jgi:hypothetical protein
MKTVLWRVYTGFVGGTHEGRFEVEDDVSEGEISQMVEDEVWDRIELCWTVENKDSENAPRPSRSRQ